MARKEKEESKKLFRKVREELNLSREKASELTGIPPERIARIEGADFEPFPDEVLHLAKGYQSPELCNYYCSQICDIGRQYVPQVRITALSQIVLEILASLNSANEKSDQLISIAVDGVISDEELKDFVYIQKELERISVAVEALQLWSEQMLATGKIDMEKYKALVDQK